jgi:hypothetical protein
MTSDAMSATDPRVVWRIVPTRIPRRQAMPRAESQLQVRVRLTTLDLAACKLFPRAPGNTVAARVRWGNLHRATGETIPKNVAHVVPDLVDIEVVRKVRLADVRLEDAAFDRADLEDDAAGHRVAMEHFAVGRVFRDGVLGADAATYGPEIDRLVALIGHDSATDGLSAGNKGKRSDSEGAKNHDGQPKRWV